MNRSIVLLVVLALLCFINIINADDINSGNCVIDVNNFYTNRGTNYRNAFIPMTREQALFNSAIHNALNTIDQEYDYSPIAGKVIVDLPRGHIRQADDCAAVYSAFHYLFNFFTNNRLKSNSNELFSPADLRARLVSESDSYYASRIADLRNSGGNHQQNSVDYGIKIGEAAALAVLSNRESDGWNSIVPEYNPAPSQGIYYNRPGEVNIYSQWRNVSTFGVPDAKSFRSPPPLDLNSQEYLETLALTKRVGRVSTSADGSIAGDRTAAQYESSRWWAGLGLDHSNVLVQALLVRRGGYSFREAARVFTAMGLSIGDAMIANLESKLFYSFYRPWQAIVNDRHLDYSAYPGLVALQDPTWAPSLVTPNNPEYPAGHPEMTSAASQAAALTLGFDSFPDGPISVNYPNLPVPVQPQTFTSFSDVQDQVAWGRVYGGMHLLTSCRTSQQLGRSIATYNVNNYLRPKN